MKVKLTLETLFLLLVLVLSAGCNSPANQSTPRTEVNKTMATSTPATSLSFEQAGEQLTKTGSVFVANVNIASELTGYSVATPSFIPDGFIQVEIPGAGGAFNVFKLGDPAHIEGVEYPYSVNIIYSQTGEFSTSVPYFQISQSRNRIGGPKGEPVQIGKYEGEKETLSYLDPPRLGLTWNDGVMYYSMEGLLLNPLDEEILIIIAASMKY